MEKRNRFESIYDIPMIEGLTTIPISSYLIFCSILFTIGVVGVLVKRNALLILMSVELMINSINLLLAAFSVYMNDPAGQIFVFFILTVAAEESGIGLAILVVLFRNLNTINVEELDRLKG